MLNISSEYLTGQIEEKVKAIKRCLIKFRGSRHYDRKGKFVVLVDDGIATGATVFAYFNWMRARKIAQIIVAVPVGPKDTIDRLEEVADGIVVLQTTMSFGAGGEFYRDFLQVTDEVVEIMQNMHERSPSHIWKSTRSRLPGAL